MRPRCALILLTVLLSGCALPGSAGRPERLSPRAETPNSSHGITLLATVPHAAPPSVMDGVAEILVTVINRGERPLQLERGQFVLAPQLAAWDGEAEAMVPAITPGRARRSQALPEGVLAPGETARGYLSFAGPGSDAQQVQLRVVDAETGEVIDILAAPLPAYPKPNINER